MSRYWKGTLFLVAAVGVAVGWWFLTSEDRAANWGYGHMMGNADWGWAMGLVMILFWVLVIVGIASFVRTLGKPDSTSADGATAVDILKRRYAAGEITREEFEAKKRDLI